jgi:TolB-like protein
MQFSSLGRTVVNTLFQRFLPITMKLLSVILLAAIFTLAMQCPVSARSLAVLPLLDLTQDENGVNFSLTDYLSKKAVEHGFTVLPDSEIMAFLVRHRIRSLGVLTSYQLTSLRQDLKAEYVLLGTVCQLGQKPAAKVSLSLQLIRTADEAVVWSIIKDLHEDDLITLLAISDPQSLNDLYER